MMKKGFRVLVVTGVAALLGLAAPAGASADDWIYADGPEVTSYTYKYSGYGTYNGGYGWPRSNYVNQTMATVRQTTGATVASATATGWSRVEYSHPSTSNTRGKCWWYKPGITGKVSMYCVVRGTPNNWARVGDAALPVDGNQIPLLSADSVAVSDLRLEGPGFVWSTSTNDQGEVCLVATSITDEEYSSSACAAPSVAAERGLGLSTENEVSGGETAYFVPDDEAAFARSISLDGEIQIVDSTGLDGQSRFNANIVQPVFNDNGGTTVLTNRSGVTFEYETLDVLAD